MPMQYRRVYQPVETRDGSLGHDGSVAEDNVDTQEQGDGVIAVIGVLLHLFLHTHNINTKHNV